MMTTTYIVEYGDWLAKIAEEHGTTVSAIWNHPENAEHRAKRGSPDVLYPGDVVRIPVVASPPAVEPAPGQPQPLPAPTPPSPDQPWPYPPFAGPWSTEPTWECPGGTCACHPVPEDEPKAEHVIVFYDPQGVRMPGARCRVYEQGRLLTPEPSAADGAGEVRVEMRASTSTLQVEWAPAHLPPNEFLPYRKMYHVKVGVRGDTAVEKRLSNLGFSRGKKLEDNVRDYQRAYSREPTGNVEEIRLEVLDRHDNGTLTVFHPQEPAGAPAAPSPQTQSFFASPPSRLSPNGGGAPGGGLGGVQRLGLAPDAQQAAEGGGSGGGGGPGATTSTGQNVQGAVVPDAGNLFLLVAIEPDSPALDPANIKVTLQPVKVPHMTAAQLAQPIKPATPPFPWMGNAGHLVYAFKDLPVGTYDALVYIDKVPRKVGKGTTFAMGHTPIEIRLGLLTMGYVGAQVGRPILTVDDPLLDLDVPPMQRRRKVLATIFKLFPASHSPKDKLPEIKGKHPPYGQPEYKQMLIGSNNEDTCTAVNGSVMANAGGHSIGEKVKTQAYFIRYADGLCPSVGDSVYYGTDTKFKHIGIVVESSAQDGAVWISADGGQPDRTSEFKQAASGRWLRSWHKPDYTGISFQSMWLLPRTFKKIGSGGGAGHGWAFPVPEQGGFYPILGWSDITHPDAPFPTPGYTTLYTEADYRSCKALIRTVRAGVAADMTACREQMDAAAP